MDSTTLICKRCKAPLEYEEGSSVARCPNCGYTELIDENDEIKLERIRIKAFKDIELGKHKIEREHEIVNNELDLEAKRLKLRKTRIVLFVLIMICIGAGSFFGIKYKNEIRIPMASTVYEGKNYNEVHTMLLDSGFHNIEDIPQETLSKNQADLIGKVTHVSINGRTAFEPKEWFPKESAVKIMYNALSLESESEIQVPSSSEECKGKNFKRLYEKFLKSGFYNTKLIPLKDIGSSSNSKYGLVESVKINGSSEFSNGRWEQPDSEVLISFHSNEIKYLGKDYETVEKELMEIGFPSIVKVPLNDLEVSELKQDGCVDSVLIDGKELAETDEFDLNEFVKIVYHSEKQANSNQVKLSINSKELVGGNYEYVVSALEDMGFVNVKQNPLEDIGKDLFRQNGKVKEVTINNQSKFSEKEIFDKDSEVIVSYHSYKKEESEEAQVLTDQQIRVTIASKELLKKNYKEAEELLKEIGFSNIVSTALGDLKKGWLQKEGNIKSISIGGSTKFAVGDIFNKDAEILIEYHSFP